jgi:hypothetical protein
VSSWIGACRTSRPRLITIASSASCAISVSTVARDQHGVALGGEAPQEVAEPTDPLGVQAVRRLVQDQDARLAEQRRAEPEPLAHA